MSHISRLVLQHAAGRARPLLLHKTFTSTARRSFTVTTRVGVAKSTPPRCSFAPSPAQQEVVRLSRTQNVVVSARPGSGKTATAEAIVAANPGLKSAILTYSKHLQTETAKRLKGYANVDVFTFHGMATRLFSTIVSNDTILNNLRKAGAILSWTDEPYDIVILDEMQDCTDHLYWLICAFLSSVTNAAGGRAPRVVVLGDERQAIYRFRGADSRYLSLAPDLLTSLSPYPCAHVALSNSFRLSHQNCTFINKSYLKGEDYITGSHDGPMPLYVHADLFDFKLLDELAELLMPLINKYGPEQTAILAPSVRQKPALYKLTNRLSQKYGIKIAVSVSDDMELDDRVLFDKLVVSTYHQFKGNERDLVIVYGTDNGYFEYYARDIPDDCCPNEVFVALTRARKQLVVMHHAKKDLMPFVSPRAIHETAHVVRLPAPGSDEELKACDSTRPQPTISLQLPLFVSVADMSRHILDDTLDAVCQRYLEIKKLAAPLPDILHIKACDKVITDAAKMHYEAVSDINGLAVVAAYEYGLMGTLFTLGHSEAYGPAAVPTGVKAQAAWICREACEYEAQESGYLSRSIQMERHPFDWLGSKLQAAKRRLHNQLKNFTKLDFEYKLKGENFAIHDEQAGKEQQTCIIGRADIVQYSGVRTPAGSSLLPLARLRDAAWSTVKHVFASSSPPAEEVCIWEIKFVSRLSLEHVIQVSAYAYLWTAKHKGESLPRILLFNVRDGEKWEIVARDGREGLRCLVEEVLRAKYSTSGGEMPTDEFLKKCTETREEVEALWESQIAAGL